jgi:predicted PurR-regulated permease PerM
MAGSIVEFSLIFLILLVIIILPIIFNSVSIIVQKMSNVEEEVSTAVRNPYASIKDIPSKLKTASKIVGKIGKQSTKGFKKMGKPMKQFK